MIRPFWFEYQFALDRLDRLCDLCKRLAGDCVRHAAGAGEEDVAGIRKRYYQLEALARDLDRKIHGLRRYTSYGLKLEALPLIGPVWRIRLNKNPWLTERREINRLDFTARREMLATKKAYGAFLYNYREIVFPVTRFHVMTDYEKLLYEFTRKKSDR
ncbi:MAG: hypothetical protein HY397_01075 [Candidatus Doudnabacteria bacterium]|nr:hypothetical protein [Candidatus Doudnabacteria bacterium]